MEQARTRIHGKAQGTTTAENETTDAFFLFFFSLPSSAVLQNAQLNLGLLIRFLGNRDISVACVLLLRSDKG